MPKELAHFVNGGPMVARATGKISNPTTGTLIALAPEAGNDDVDRAVAAAKAALPGWSQTGLQQRAFLMLELRQALSSAHEELTHMIVEELGKTTADAAAEVERAIEIFGQAASVGTWYGAPFTPGVSRGVDAFEIRSPIGVIAAISPFNFPILIPAVQCANAIACGNTVVLKPSDRVPSASLRMAELLTGAGLPDGVMNVVLGGASAVERLVEHPDVAGITFVGSTPVARSIRTKGVANNKRVQAFGGGKNHMVVLPDADLDLAADAAVSGAFGAAGQRCMAVSVVVAVGSIADELVAKIVERAEKLRLGSPADLATDVGPLVSSASLARITGYLAEANDHGAILARDGRNGGKPAEGAWLAPTVIDRVAPGSPIHSDELFGPVLSVVRVATYDEASAVLAEHTLGNGAAIFTRDGGVARTFVEETEAGQIGVNIPIPFPAFFHGFGGWKDSAFTETKLFGPGALAFCTRTKTVSARWPDPATSKIDLGFPAR